jgi:RNA polymerase sigma-70 factor (ECF subfamily)
MVKGNTETYNCLEQWHRGDQRGLDALLERHLPWLHAHVRKRIGSALRNKDESMDYVQDAVVEFLRYGPRIKISDDAMFRALLMRIIENTVHHRHRWYTALRRDIAKERPLPTDTILYLDPPIGQVRTPSQSAERHEEEAWVRLGLEILEPDYREILVLRKWEKLSFSRIGEKLGITEVAARMKHNRAVSCLGSVVCALRAGELERILEQDSH